MLRRLRIENLVLIHEAELAFAPGLNAITGETGAGKTILAQAVGLLLGSAGDAALVGAAGSEAYVEAELDVPDALTDADELEALAQLRPEGEEDLVLARRVFADGRTRAYAWGRAAAREDVAAAAELLVAMSGQFEQRRLARSTYQLEVLDAYCGDAQLRRRSALRRAWRELRAAERRLEEISAGTDAAEARRAELRALVEDMDGVTAEGEEALLFERERLRHVTELAAAAAAAAHALDPEDGQGALALAATAGAALAAVDGIAVELDEAASELREADVRLREAASAVRSFLLSLDADPARLELVESELEQLSDLRRRHRASSIEELVARAAEARSELEAHAAGADPLATARAALAAARETEDRLAGELGEARRAAADAFAAEVSAGLAGVGMGDGEFRVELETRPASASGRESATFLVRPNAGLPAAPVAQTASGGELSRIALAIAAVGGGHTLVFDEIDAGIGGTTAHGVADALTRLASRAQVVVITHLPQIASRAERHFSVEKVPGDPTHTRIRLLSDEDRRGELERMLGGREFLATVAEGAEA